MSDHTGVDGEGLVDRVCHDEQMTIWTGEIVDSLSMGGYFRERLSYDDGLHIHAAIARDLRIIIASAFLQAEPPAPCDEPPSGRDRNGLGGDSPAGAVGGAEAPAQTLPKFIREFKDDPTKAWIRIEVLKAALAESERKRLEAERAAIELARAAYGVDATAPSEAQMERLHLRAGRGVEAAASEIRIQALYDAAGVPRPKPRDRGRAA